MQATSGKPTIVSGSGDPIIIPAASAVGQSKSNGPGSGQFYTHVQLGSQEPSGSGPFPTVTRGSTPYPVPKPSSHAVPPGSIEGRTVAYVSPKK